jgi:hypothetical protein
MKSHPKGLAKLIRKVKHQLVRSIDCCFFTPFDIVQQPQFMHKSAEENKETERFSQAVGNSVTNANGLIFSQQIHTRKRCNPEE